MTANYMNERPGKKIFSKKVQSYILSEARKYIKKNIPQNTEISMTRIFGSIAKGAFGVYSKPWKGRKYSDIDIVFIVEKDFKAPKWKIHFKPKHNGWIVYDIGKLKIDKTINKIKYSFSIDIQFIIVKENKSKNITILNSSEKWGIPLKKNSKHKYVEV